MYIYLSITYLYLYTYNYYMKFKNIFSLKNRKQTIKKLISHCFQLSLLLMSHKTTNFHFMIQTPHVDFQLFFFLQFLFRNLYVHVSQNIYICMLVNIHRYPQLNYIYKRYTDIFYMKICILI